VLLPVRCAAAECCTLLWPACCLAWPAPDVLFALLLFFACALQDIIIYHGHCTSTLHHARK
jgi:hypothetical protein